MNHLLKTWQGEFEAVASGSKVHEVRNADRDFKVGDTLILAEWNPAVFEQQLMKMTKEKADKAAFTGRRLLRLITYVTKAGSWGLPKDICVLSTQGIGRQ